MHCNVDVFMVRSLQLWHISIVTLDRTTVHKVMTYKLTTPQSPLLSIHQDRLRTSHLSSLRT